MKTGYPGWKVAYIRFDEIKVRQYDNPGDVKGVLTEDIGNNFDEAGNPVKWAEHKSRREFDHAEGRGHMEVGTRRLRVYPRHPATVDRSIGLMMELGTVDSG